VTPSGYVLLQSALPFLRHKDACGLTRLLRRNWPNERLLRMLASQDPETVKLTVVCLSLTADMEATPHLAAVLQHDDPVAAYLAEHALWSTWFRGGSTEASASLRQAVRLTANQELSAAVQLLSEWIEKEPDFAELYNQRAIAHFLGEQFKEAIADCQRTVELNPFHFGAFAGMGHCYTQLGDFQRARESYYEALRIHPRVAGIRQTLRYLRRAQEKKTSNKLSAS